MAGQPHGTAQLSYWFPAILAALLISVLSTQSFAAERTVGVILLVLVLVPHVGGPIIGPGCPTVLIGGMPAARVTDMVTCVGPPDVIILGSFTVLIGGMPAARLGDMTAHGGAIVLGYPMVLIG